MTGKRKSMDDLLPDMVYHQPSQPEGFPDAQKAEDQGRKESKDGKNDARVQDGQPAIGVEDRPQGEGPQTGDSDRPQPERTVQEIYAEQVRKQAEETRKRDLLNAPYKIRVLLRDGRGSYLDMDCVRPWPEWLQGLQVWRGIAHDKGFMPVEAIALITHLDIAGKPSMELGENVVPFKKPPAA